MFFDAVILVYALLSAQPVRLCAVLFWCPCIRALTISSRSREECCRWRERRECETAMWMCSIAASRVVCCCKRCGVPSRWWRGRDARCSSGAHALHQASIGTAQNTQPSPVVERTVENRTGIG